MSTAPAPVFAPTLRRAVRRAMRRAVVRRVVRRAVRIPFAWLCAVSCTTSCAAMCAVQCAAPARSSTLFEQSLIGTEESALNRRLSVWFVYRCSNVASHTNHDSTNASVAPCGSLTRCLHPTHLFACYPTLFRTRIQSCTVRTVPLVRARNQL